MTVPLTNQGFDTDLTGWNATGNPSTFEWVDGKAHLVAGVTNSSFVQNLSTYPAGTTFTFRYRVTDAAVNNFRLGLWDGTQTIWGSERSEPGTYTEVLTSVNTGLCQVVMNALVGGEVYVDYIYGGSHVAGYITIDMIDRDDDSRQFTLPATQITAANHDAQYTLAQALVAGVEGISRLVTRKWDFGARRTETGDPRPTAGSAQVNIEWQVTYQEATTLEVRTVRIGGANLDIASILLPSSNVADLTQAQMAAFKTAFEAYVLGPNGNAVTVQQVAFLE